MSPSIPSCRSPWRIATATRSRPRSRSRFPKPRYSCTTIPSGSRRRSAIRYEGGSLGDELAEEVAQVRFLLRRDLAIEHARFPGPQFLLHMAGRARTEQQHEELLVGR